VRLPRVTVRSDIHCATTWSRFDNLWEGVAIAEILSRVKVRPEAMAVMVHAEQGYTTNVLLDDLKQSDVLLALRHDGADLEPITADRAGSWCRAATSGRARNGCARSNSSTTTRRASGRGTATTFAPTPGRGALLGRRDARNAAHAHGGRAPYPRALAPQTFCRSPSGTTSSKPQPSRSSCIRPSAARLSPNRSCMLSEKTNALDGTQTWRTRSIIRSTVRIFL
jgi:hypothetical protein